MECSALNAHLYRNNIVPSPSCICGGFENPYHFLFVCPKYTVAKNMFFPNNLTNYTTQDLLLGKEREPVSEKKDSARIHKLNSNSTSTHTPIRSVEVTLEEALSE